MKRIILFFAVMFTAFVANAQIFTQKELLDKFDDSVKTKNIKTLVTQTSTSITFEEKGEKPFTFYRSIDGALGHVQDTFNYGSIGQPINLVNDVYGYQTTYIYYNNEIPYHIVHRVVTSKFGTYKNEYWWIENPDGTRLVYSK